ncbi:hypothetical protein F2Q68_00012011 [Brassica cretica]|uniref:Uncharacterized protein n=1 Tax=Brassica cretica TaxID=69181 RepID=A0A8S9L4U5_BRACR|nr:hypothetical protein F2Q68_00012011 [Brassica cretica]
MNLGRELRRGRELSSSYWVSSRDGRLQLGSRDEAETDASSSYRVRELVDWAGADRMFSSRNASKNNLGFFGIRATKDQDGAAYFFCE